MEWMEYLHTALEVAVELGIMLFEWVGVAVLVVSGGVVVVSAKAIRRWVSSSVTSFRIILSWFRSTP